MGFIEPLPSSPKTYSNFDRLQNNGLIFNAALVMQVRNGKTWMVTRVR